MAKKEIKDLTLDEKYERLSSLEKKLETLSSELPEYAHSMSRDLIPDPIVRFLHENTGNSLKALKDYALNLKATAGCVENLISIFEGKALDIWTPEPGIFLVRGNETALDSAASQGLLRIELDEDMEDQDEFDTEDDDIDNGEF